jgi:glutamine synthetase
MILNSSGGKEVPFADRSVFIRSITDLERVQYCNGDFENEFYLFIDTDGKILAMIEGNSEVAFSAAKTENAIPQWVH